MAKAKPKPAPKPAAKAAPKPAPKAAPKPAPAPRTAPKPAVKPAARAAPKPPQRTAQRPPAKPKPAPNRQGSGGAHKPAPGHATAKPKGKAAGGKPKAQAPARAARGKPNEGPDDLTLYQQEVDVLRGQVGQLHVTGLWTSANPPKVAGIYGKLLQGLMAGVSLRDAFANLNHAAAATRDNNAKILAFVKAHKTPTFKVKKGK